MAFWNRKDPPETKSVELPEWVLDNFPGDDFLSILPVGAARAVGLPALLACIRLLSHAAGMVPMEVMRQLQDGRRVRAYGEWQYRLINRRPGPPPNTPFHFQADLAANFAGRGNAYIRKYKPTVVQAGRPRVVQMRALNASQMCPEYGPLGQVVFQDSTQGNPVTRGTDEIIHIRSFSLGRVDGYGIDNALEGVSPITAARLMITAALRRQTFEDAYLKNGISPSFALKYPQGVQPETAERWIELMQKQHAGKKVGRILAVGGGADLETLPVSLKDAEFAEQVRLTLAQAAAMYQIPLSFFNPSPGAQGSSEAPTDADWRFFLTFALGPFFTALAQAYTADDDLFSADEAFLSANANTDALHTLDPNTKANVQKAQIQTGVRLPDELRADDGYGPLPPIPSDWTQAPGQVPQITPVGGAPNPAVNTGDSQP